MRFNGGSPNVLASQSTKIWPKADINRRDFIKPVRSDAFSFKYRELIAALQIWAQGRSVWETAAEQEKEEERGQRGGNDEKLKSSQELKKNILEHKKASDAPKRLIQEMCNF